MLILLKFVSTSLDLRFVPSDPFKQNLYFHILLIDELPQIPLVVYLYEMLIEEEEEKGKEGLTR